MYSYVYILTLIDRQVALAIINSDHWKEALKGCDKDSSTPLRLLIKYLPGMYATKQFTIILLHGCMFLRCS